MGTIRFGALIKGYIAGFVVMIGVFILLLLLALVGLIGSQNAHNSNWIVIFFGLGPFAAGYVAAKSAQTAQLLHGLLVGALYCASWWILAAIHPHAAGETANLYSLFNLVLVIGLCTCGSYAALKKK